MTDKQLERINKVGLSAEQFAPKHEETTVEDLLEAINLLAEMVFAESEDE